MRNNKRPTRMRSEDDMEKGVVRYLKCSGPTVRQVSLQGCRFDVVSYDRKKNIFKLVECKLAKGTTAIGRTFGQLASYHATMQNHGRAFVNAASRELGLDYDHLMDATHSATEIRVSFYVALTDSACRNRNLLDSMKALLPSIGIIRVNPSCHCRAYLLKHGKSDKRICSARPITIRVSEREGN